MKQIHNKRPVKRIVIGEPFERLVAELQRGTNTGNLSPNWDATTMCRYALATLWQRNKKAPLPSGCAEMLKPYIPDLDV